MNKLKNIREHRGFTQGQIAKKAHVSERGYQRYEAEESQRVPDAKTAILIAQALGTTVEILWGNSLCIKK